MKNGFNACLLGRETKYNAYAPNDCKGGFALKYLARGEARLNEQGLLSLVEYWLFGLLGNGSTLGGGSIRGKPYSVLHECGPTLTDTKTFPIYFTITHNATTQICLLHMLAKFNRFTNVGDLKMALLGIQYTVWSYWV